MTRLYVFDLDGTLVDSLRDLADSANELLGECGRPPLAVDAVGRMVGEGAAQLIARVFAASGVEMPPDALPRFLTIYDTRLLNHTRAYAGMPETLETLRAKAPLAVLTNKPLEATKRILDGVGLSEFFDAGILGGDGPQPRKPDPQGMLSLCERARVTAADAMLVGDSYIDWKTAKNAGTQICLARYGFGFREFPQENLNAGEQLIDAPADILSLV